MDRNACAMFLTERREEPPAIWFFRFGVAIWLSRLVIIFGWHAK
jgi:hypothetical protein